MGNIRDLTFSRLKILDGLRKRGIVAQGRRETRVSNQDDFFFNSGISDLELDGNQHGSDGFVLENKTNNSCAG